MNRILLIEDETLVSDVIKKYLEKEGYEADDVLGTLSKRAEKEGGFQEGRLICHGKPRFPEKAKERPDLGGLSSGGKNRKRDRLYHRRTVREDPGD